MDRSRSRRSFLQTAGLGAAFGIQALLDEGAPVFAAELEKFLSFFGAEGLNDGTGFRARSLGECGSGCQFVGRQQQTERQRSRDDNS